MSSSKLNTRLSTERSIVSGSSKFKVKHRPSIAAVTSQVHKLGLINLLNPTPLWALAVLLKVSCSTQSWNPWLVFAPAQNLQCSTPSQVILDGEPYLIFFNWIWEFHLAQWPTKDDPISGVPFFQPRKLYLNGQRVTWSKVAMQRYCFCIFKRSLTGKYSTARAARTEAPTT